MDLRRYETIRENKIMALISSLMCSVNQRLPNTFYHGIFATLQIISEHCKNSSYFTLKCLVVYLSIKNYGKTKNNCTF